VPGHWAHRERAERYGTRQAGKIKVIGVIDDHTRLVYTEIHRAENAKTVSQTLTRAVARFREQGCGPVQAVMSDNAKRYPTWGIATVVTTETVRLAAPTGPSYRSSPGSGPAARRRSGSGAGLEQRTDLDEQLVLVTGSPGEERRPRPSQSRGGCESRPPSSAGHR
jgi:hypothetical protein